MSRIIKDCIYRFIEIPELCQKFMDTPIFQRLRRIRQLGLAHYVYPSAVHTRFEHSLGVMYLAGIVVDQLRKYTEISDREKELVMLAGLLHDVGHYPFSHLFDTLLELNDEKDIPKEHEQRSVQFVSQINDEVGCLTENEVRMVQNMILGKVSEERKYLYEIVCNAENGLDVDKMDYLQRDAYHTGLPGFQPDYIIQGMRIKDSHIAFLQKTKFDIQDLYRTRKRMFRNVYYHKTSTKMEKMYLKMMIPIIKDFLKETRIENMDDFALESFLRKRCPESMAKIDRRTFDSPDIHLEKTPTLNGHITGKGEIIYV